MKALVGASVERSEILLRMVVDDWSNHECIGMDHNLRHLPRPLLRVAKAGVLGSLLLTSWEVAQEAVEELLLRLCLEVVHPLGRGGQIE